MSEVRLSAEKRTEFGKGGARRTRRAGKVPAVITQSQDVGTHAMLTARLGESTLKARLAPDAPLPDVGSTVWLRVVGNKSCFYRDEELVA